MRLPRQKAKHYLAAAAWGTTLVVATAAALLYFGAYNVSGLQQHTWPVYRLLQFTMERAVAVRVDDIRVPILAERDWRNSGLGLYEAHCRRCHGAPGVAPESFALGMIPAPTAIAELARKRGPREIYWVVKHGIKMTGMPAWQYRLSDGQMWDVVALVKQLPDMTVADYARARADARPLRQPLQSTGVTTTDEVERGRTAMQQYNCVSCHVIPGLTAARHHVGPPLTGVTRRAFIAGVLEFSERNFIRWVQDPLQVDPHTAMPNLGVTEAHARDMLAYLQWMDATD